MTLTVTPESKNGVTITNVSKPSTGTFGSTPGRRFSDGGTFGVPGLAILKETKNGLSVSNETKV